jgi:hypothetical protein
VVEPFFYVSQPFLYHFALFSGLAIVSFSYVWFRFFLSLFRILFDLLFIVYSFLNFIFLILDSQNLDFFYIFGLQSLIPFNSFFILSLFLFLLTLQLVAILDPCVSIPFILFETYSMVFFAFNSFLSVNFVFFTLFYIVSCRLPFLSLSFSYYSSSSCFVLFIA